MRRTVLLTAFVLALLAGWGALRAQTVTSDDLAAAALTADDLPGYQFASESVTPPPTGFDATYARIFSSDQNGGAILVDALLLPGDAVPIDALATVLGRDTLFRGLASALQIPVSNFRLTGPLGIGDSDQSAVWEGSDPNSGQPLVFYADGFLRGRLLAFILYAAPPDSADPSQLTVFAGLQDQKLLASALPPAVITPSAPSSPPTPAMLAPQPAASPATPDTSGAASSAHVWYTSAASNATAYYCDDDPDWRTLSPANLRSFPSVAALLAVYPGRRLHRPCLDGATGP